MQQKIVCTSPTRKGFSYTPWAYILSMVAGSMAAPIGIFLSPLALFFSNRKGEYIAKNGAKVTPMIMWFGSGMIVTPVCWMINFTVFNKPAADKAGEPSAIVSTTQRPQISPVRFGVGDDVAAWLSRCAPPEVDTSTAYDNPRPPIVTRFFDYLSKGVRVIFVPNAPIGTVPPYSSWRFIGVTDPATKQPIDASEALARMGNSCRRG
jgi:hypothetical protein